MSCTFNVSVRDNFGAPVVGARVAIITKNASILPATRLTVGDGGCNLYWQGPGFDPPLEIDVMVDAAGYKPWCTEATPVMFGTSDVTLQVKLESFKRPGRSGGIGTGVDPSTISLEQLARIRGAMWTARLDIPLGHRPNQPDNILAMDYYEHYDTDDRKRMIEKYKSYGYTHAVTGPLVDTWGYHGEYPPSDYRSQEQFDQYLDCIQEWWDAGIIPIHFCHPDGWSIEQMEELIPLYQQERAQRLLRIIVWTGWEPATYEWTNAYWVRLLQQGNQVFPNALHGVHTVADIDALTGQDDDRTFPKGEGNVISWRNAVPYLHLWFVQNAGYFRPIENRNDPRWRDQYETFKKNFALQFDPEAGRASLKGRFVHGTAGWPTNSKWGPDRPLRIIAAEFASYPNYWQNWPEAEAIELGDIAIRAGADGVLDGCSIDVP